MEWGRKWPEDLIKRSNNNSAFLIELERVQINNVLISLADRMDF